MCFSPFEKRRKKQEPTKTNENNYEAKNDKIKSLYVRPYFRFHHHFNDAKAEIFMCSLRKLDENIYINDRRIKRQEGCKMEKERKTEERKKKKRISLSKNKQKEKKIKIQSSNV